MKTCICGHRNDDEMRFCEACGQLLPEKTRTYGGGTRRREDSDEAINIVDAFADFIGKLFSMLINFLGKKKESVEIADYKDKTKTFVPHKIKMCDGEKLVKQYYYAKETLALFGYKMYHFLQVTNKRVIYCKMGNSFFGPKEVQTEVPVDDIANISIEKGFKINIFSFLLAGLHMYQYALIMLPVILIGYFLFRLDGVGLIAMLAAGTTFYFSLNHKEIRINGKRYIISDALNYACFSLMLLPSALCAARLGESVSFFGYGSNVITVNNIFTTFEVNTSLYKFFVIIASVMCWFFSVRLITDLTCNLTKKYYNVKIASKSGQNYPIGTMGLERYAIVSDLFEEFVPVVPEADAYVMESELNAMILDIQQLGNYGIEKWQEK